MFSRLPLLLARRVAVPTAASRPLLTRPFSYTPLAFSPVKAKTPAKPKTATKTKAKSTTTTTTTAAKTRTKAKTQAKDKPKAKAKTSGRRKVAKKVAKPTFAKEDLKVPTRRPPSSYLAFAIEQVAKLPKAKTIVEARERTKTIAAQWKNLSEEDRQVYKERSAQSAKEIKAGYDAWMANVDPAILREINRKRKARGKPKIRTPSKGPKGPAPAFIRFLGDFRGENPGLTAQQTGRQGGFAWRQLPQARKDVYITAYHDAKKAQEARA